MKRKFCKSIITTMAILTVLNFVAVIVTLVLWGVGPKNCVASAPGKHYPKDLCFWSSETQPRQSGHEEHDGQLILTPFVKEGRLEEARELARVIGSSHEVLSYSGYLTVNPKYNSNLFFWFFPAVINPETAPLVLWLQGGPGGSSMFGVFVEHGPYKIDENSRIHLRNTSWTQNHSVLYIDNPIGTGFSFTDHDCGYAREQSQISSELYNALSQFFTLFPDYTARDFYLSGESFAGKFILNLARKIINGNRNGIALKMNLKGLLVLNGWIDPQSLLHYGNHFYNLGLLDEDERDLFIGEEKAAAAAMEQKNWNKVNEIMSRLLYGDENGASYYTNMTGFTYNFNVLLSAHPPEFKYFENFIQTPNVRRSIHVGNQTFANGAKVERYLALDIYQSALPLMKDILDAPEGYRVMLCYGQWDMTVTGLSVKNLIAQLKWSGASDVANSTKKIWWVTENGEKFVGGYIKTVRNFSHMTLRNSGHILPYDKPRWVLEILSRFTRGEPVQREFKYTTET